VSAIFVRPPANALVLDLSFLALQVYTHPRAKKPRLVQSIAKKLFLPQLLANAGVMLCSPVVQSKRSVRPSPCLDGKVCKATPPLSLSTYSAYG
jgi:hypothetical protein